MDYLLKTEPSTYSFADLQRENAELRAALSLADHQRLIGEPCTARNRIASLCDWFPPASDLPDVLRLQVAGSPGAVAVQPHDDVGDEVLGGGQRGEHRAAGVLDRLVPDGRRQPGVVRRGVRGEAGGQRRPVPAVERQAAGIHQ